MQKSWWGWLIAPVLGCLLTLGPWIAPVWAATTPGAAAQPFTLDVAVNVGNVRGFSARDKTYTVEGTLRVSAPAAVMERLQAAGVEPVELLRFQNQVQPWNSLMEPDSSLIKLGTKMGRTYRFKGFLFRRHQLSRLSLRHTTSTAKSCTSTQCQWRNSSLSL